MDDVGGYISLIVPITATVFGTRHIDINYGIMLITLSVGGIVGSRLAAVVKVTHGGSHHQAYVIALFMCIVGLMPAILALVKSRNPQPVRGGVCPWFRGKRCGGYGTEMLRLGGWHFAVDRINFLTLFIVNIFCCDNRPPARINGGRRHVSFPNPFVAYYRGTRRWICVFARIPFLFFFCSYFQLSCLH